jgi:hypothetical protein
MKWPAQNILFGLVLAAAVVGSQVSCGKRPPPVEPASAPVEAAPALSNEVERLLQKKMELVAALVSEPVILEAVREANRKNTGLTMAQIQELDRKWMQTPGVDEFMRGFMTNPAAMRLLEFQKIHAEFGEIFVTDGRGLNVAQTNKTSDYYQADEEWWGVAFAGGRGKSYHGKIEYDESSRTRAISVYVPVMDQGAAIGVCKAVVSMDALGREL